VSQSEIGPRERRLLEADPADQAAGTEDQGGRQNRKEAEAKITDAEKAIASARSFDAPVAAAEKAFEEARQAIQQKDYKLSCPWPRKSIDACEASRARSFPP